MILLEPGNRILGETVTDSLSEDTKVEPMDVRLCDFDDVTYRVTIDAADMKTMQVSMNLPCYHQIKDKGAEAALTRVYGDIVASEAVTGFDISLNVPLEEKKDAEELAKKVTLFKQNIVGGVFDHFYSALLDGKPETEPFKFDLRGDTTVYFFPGKDRVVTIFALDFTEQVDKTIAKVFMQEFVDSRRRVSRAPPVSWGENPPKELGHFNITENEGNLGYISFAILKSHLDKGKKETVISVLQVFRNYIQYHIKCSKSFFHQRMRARVRALIKVLNRARFDADEVKEKKTAAGKTFKRN